MALNGRQRTRLVGAFFESLGKQLMRAHLDVVDSEDARLQVGRKNIGLEFKGIGNNDLARIRLAQLDRFTAMNLVVFDHFLYLLFCYTSRQCRPKAGMRRKKRNRIFAHCYTEEKVCQALLDNLKSVFILDIDALQAVRNRYGVAKRGFPYEPEQLVTAIPRALMQKLANGHAAEALEELGLNHGQWSTWHHKVRVKLSLKPQTGPVIPSVIDLQVVNVVPKQLRPLLEKIIKPTSRRLVSRSVQVDLGELQALVAAA